MRAPTVTVARGRLDLGGELLPLWSGSFHYWRHDPADWPLVFDSVASLGYRVIDTYFPWSVHEVGEGRFDWSGRRDAEAFLRLAHERGIKVIARPGPHINSELPDFGFPRRVLDDPDCQALGPLRTPVVMRSMTHFFPVPSYVAPRFLAECDAWLDEVMPRLAALQWPDGPVVTCQVDNEMDYMFHQEPFSLDYRPEFVAGWRAHSGLEGEPPVDGTEDPARIDSWVAYRSVHQREALARLAAGMRERGMDRVPLFHDDHDFGLPLDQAALEASGAVDVAGCNCYAGRVMPERPKQVARTLAGSSRLPFIPELGAGWVTDLGHYPYSRDIVDEELCDLGMLLGGARAWNFYMLVERERWYGSPIGPRGEQRGPLADLHRRLNAMLHRLRWWELERDAPVLLLRNKPLERYVNGRQVACEAASVLQDRLFPRGLRVPLGAPGGWEQPPHAAWESFYSGWRARLEAAGLDFDEGSSDAPPDLDRYRLVVTAAAPRFPAPLANPRLTTAPDDAFDDLPSAAFTHDGGPGISLHRYTRGDGLEVLGALNVSDRDARFHVSAPGLTGLAGAWRAESLRGSGAVEVRVPAYGGQVWEVTRG